MKLIYIEDYYGGYECSKGHRFHVDATTEEGLYLHLWVYGLYAECPTCGERERPTLKDWWTHRLGMWTRIWNWGILRKGE